ncbi:hypothetical protein ATANTOWER_022144, partial [Ataeniobius toweri]|nr:hypothetical protein [Ataeniobius toweri]
LVTRNNQQSLPDEVHNAEMPGFATAHCAQYHQLQAPQHVQQLQDSLRQRMSGYSSEQYNSPPGLPQRAQNDFRRNNIHQDDPMLVVPNYGCNYGTTRMTGEDVQLLKSKSVHHVSFANHFCFSHNDFNFSPEDLAIHKMHSVLTEVLVIVKDLSRDVQLIKNELAKGNMTPCGTQGPATTTLLLPFQLPIACEQDFNEAESLLMEESVCQKMIARLALVGGTNSDNCIRRMLATAITNALASRFNWAGKKDKRCSESKKPFKDTTLQDCMLV